MPHAYVVYVCSFQFVGIRAVPVLAHCRVSSLACRRRAKLGCAQAVGLQLVGDRDVRAPPRACANGARPTRTIAQRSAPPSYRFGFAAASSSPLEWQRRSSRCFVGTGSANFLCSPALPLGVSFAAKASEREAAGGASARGGHRPLAGLSGEAAHIWSIAARAPGRSRARKLRKRGACVHILPSACTASPSSSRCERWAQRTCATWIECGERSQCQAYRARETSCAAASLLFGRQ